MENKSKDIRNWEVWCGDMQLANVRGSKPVIKLAKVQEFRDYDASVTDDVKEMVYASGHGGVTEEERKRSIDEGKVTTATSKDFTNGDIYHGHLDNKGKFVIDEIKDGVEKRLSDEAAKLIVSNVTGNSFEIHKSDLNDDELPTEWKKPIEKGDVLSFEVNPPESWEEEFDKSFPARYEWREGGRLLVETDLTIYKNKIKAFISQLLSTERERVVKMCGGMKAVSVEDDYAFGYNAALEDIINKLTPSSQDEEK